MKVCSTPGCPELTPSGKCEAHRTEARRANDAKRPRSERRYGRTFETNRLILLARHPYCACGCGKPSNTADHWPETRASLVARGVTDPDALHRLRALNSACHNRETARAPRPERRGVG